MSSEFSTRQLLTSRINFPFHFNSANVLRKSEDLNLQNFIINSDIYWIFKISNFQRSTASKRVELRRYANLVEMGRTVAQIWRFFDFSKMATVAILDLLCGWLDHPRRAFGAKFGWNRCSSFDNMQVLVLCEFGLKTPIHVPWGCGWGTFPQIMSLIVLTLKTVVRGRITTSFEPCIKRVYQPHGSSWALEREKRQDRKKVTKGLYFTYLGRSPIEAISIKIVGGAGSASNTMLPG